MSQRWDRDSSEITLSGHDQWKSREIIAKIIWDLNSRKGMTEVHLAVIVAGAASLYMVRNIQVFINFYYLKTRLMVRHLLAVCATPYVPRRICATLNDP